MPDSKPYSKLHCFSIDMQINEGLKKIPSTNSACIKLTSFSCVWL